MLNENNASAMRVLYVVPGTGEGHSMVFAHNEIAQMRLMGIDTVTYLTGTGFTMRRFIKILIEIRQEIRKHKPDLVHVHFGSFTSFASVCVSSIPVIVTFRGSDLNPSPSDGSIRSMLRNLFSQLTALRAESMICVSSRLLDRLWWRKKHAKVIPTGIDLNRFQCIPQDVARRRLGWREDELVVLFNVGLSPAVKRLDLAEAAIDEVRKRIGEVRFVILKGDTPYEDIPFYLCGADCLIFTSDFEGSPNIVKESLACNLPVVSVEVGDVPERLVGVAPSCIVERTPEALAAATVDILKEKKRSNGREVISSLSRAKLDRELYNVYRRVLRYPVLPAE